MVLQCDVTRVASCVTVFGGGPTLRSELFSALLLCALLEKIIIVRTPRGAKSASNKNRLDRPRPNEGSLVGWREWANRGLPFGHRIPTDIGGTALRSVTTYPTLFGQDEVSDFHSNCLCASGRGTEGVQRALP